MPSLTVRRILSAADLPQLVPAVRDTRRDLDQNRVRTSLTQAVTETQLERCVQEQRQRGAFLVVLEGLNAQTNPKEAVSVAETEVTLANCL